MRAGGDSAFARLPELDAAARGSRSAPTSGTVTYTVRQVATLKPTAGLLDRDLFTAHVPGRLVLVGIRYGASGNRLGEVLVLTAELTAARHG